jgi:type II secretory pathway component PulJ
MSQNTNEKQPAGIRWLAIFEQSASAILAAMVIGLVAIYSTVLQTNTIVTSLVERLDRLEQKTDSRIQTLERDVKLLQIEQARNHGSQVLKK